MEKCDGCLQEVYSFNNPCMDCIKARHRAVLAGRCACGRKRRENPTIHRVGSRTWKTCDRCLKTTGQLS